MDNDYVLGTPFLVHKDYGVAACGWLKAASRSVRLKELIVPRTLSMAKRCNGVRRPLLSLLVALALTVCAQAQARSESPGPAHDPLADAAFDHFYNMEYDRATQEFQKNIR